MAELPEELKLALRAFTAGRSRRGLAERSGHISAQYRERVPSARHVAADEDALAYALSRMPATYAAVSYALAEARELIGGFAPETLLDAGAGPGTASWAACEIWPELADITMLDHNQRFLSLAEALAAGSSFPALRAARAVRGELTALPLSESRYDLVTLGYALTELPDERVVPLALDLWKQTEGVLVIVEPGRPRDYQRLMQARKALVAAGARIVAPCPHADDCPLTGDDWCHFSVRLARSRDHQTLKNARLGYEDEKFSYIVAARPPLAGEGGWSRVIKPPAATKFSIDTELCTATRLAHQRVLKREGEAFKKARKLEWGDRAVEPQV
ncbi:hypothetical protein VE25_18280 [Devosia geojensis]|uniref:SAM-dependent methyltransferase n=1 Tax=Devosia geojensis TaxID=443610 RepID=A0A0F5FHU6_9HYPH|nr:small ribosomal subunit Rsm22 family protein [Devosia geojensis]KKB08469.1 hypothetical protein VE25_18280 [Devosia geojensis]